MYWMLVLFDAQKLVTLKHIVEMGRGNAVRTRLRAEC
jgi:hypothetical protein